MMSILIRAFDAASNDGARRTEEDVMSVSSDALLRYERAQARKEMSLRELRGCRRRCVATHPLSRAMSRDKLRRGSVQVERRCASARVTRAARQRTVGRHDMQEDSVAAHA